MAAVGRLWAGWSWIGTDSLMQLSQRSTRWCFAGVTVRIGVVEQCVGHTHSEVGGSPRPDSHSSHCMWTRLRNLQTTQVVTLKSSTSRE